MGNPSGKLIINVENYMGNWQIPMLYFSTGKSHLTFECLGNRGPPFGRPRGRARAPGGGQRAPTPTNGGPRRPPTVPANLPRRGIRRGSPKKLI
jgi:hypothetical protein